MKATTPARLLLASCLAIALAGCTKKDDSPSGPGGGGDLGGWVLGTLSGRPLAGLTVSTGGVSDTTGGDGSFLLEGTGTDDLLVTVGGPGVVTRRQFVPFNASAAVTRAALAAAGGVAGAGRGGLTAAAAGAAARAAGPVALDVIEEGLGFNLAFYREIARGNHPQEGNLYPLIRWTHPTPPTVYIDTNAAAAVDGRIDQATINAVRNVIAQVVPVWSGGTYPAVNVVAQRFPDSLVNNISNLDAGSLNFGLVPENSIVITFDDTVSAFGYGIGINSAVWDGYVQPITKAIVVLVDHPSLYAGFSLEEAVAHEVGHIFGYWHTSALPSVMVKLGEFGRLYSEADVLHAAVVYRRPVGNTDVDNDPADGGPRTAGSLRRALHFEPLRAPVAPDLARRIRAVQPRLPYRSLLD